MKTNFLSLSATLLACALFTSCNNEYIDLEVEMKLTGAKRMNMYSETFKEIIGDISPDEHWDFSEEGTKLGTVTRATNDITISKVDGIDWGVTNTANKDAINSTLSKNNTLYNQIKTSLPDNIKHTGKTAILTAPANSFTIYPLTAQGGFTHELYIKVGDADEVKIYSKDWTEYSKPYCNGMGTAKTVNTVNTTVYTISSKTYTADQITESYQNTYYNKLTLNSNGSTLGYLYTKNNSYKNNIYNQPNYDTYAKNPKATWIGEKTTTTTTTYEVTKTADMPGVTITAPVGTPIQLYMKNVSGYSGKNFNIGTGSGNAIIVDCPVKPEGLPTTIMPENAEIKFVGFEDQVTHDGKNITGVGGDFDYNDLVVMIVGAPKAPQELEIKDNEYERLITKRYMIEDLGATSKSDLDFNDIVIDLETYETHKTKMTNGAVTSDEFIGYKKQRAILRALGGTMDLMLYVGNTPIFQKGDCTDKDGKKIKAQRLYNVGLTDDEIKTGDEDYINYDGLIKEIKLADNTWNPMTNNISVTMMGYVADEDGNIPTGNLTDGINVYDISFPEKGRVPAMIAFDVTKKWRPERCGITKQEGFSWFLKEQ